MYPALEQITSTIYSKHLSLLIPLYGIDCEQLRKITTVEDDAYGIHSGTLDTEVIGPIKILFSTSQWRVVTEYDAGYIDYIGWLYTTDLVQDGDNIKITRSDGKEIMLKLLGTESIGLTTQLIYRFRITNVGDI
jgi:hypothetical protein